MGKHAKYPEPLAHYAQAYGRSVESIKAWVAQGKASGWLPPLDDREAMRSWCARHMERVPDDLAALCAEGGKVAAATNGGTAGNGQEEGARPATPMLPDLEAAVVEIRAILSTDIAELKRGGHSIGERSRLLRHVQQTSDSLCKLENTLVGLRREKRDALPWAVFVEAVRNILERLVEIRKGMPSRVMGEVEEFFANRARRMVRVVRLIKEPLAEAITKVCEQDVRVLVTCAELRPVYEQMRARARELPNAVRGPHLQPAEAPEDRKFQLAGSLQTARAPEDANSELARNGGGDKAK